MPSEEVRRRAAIDDTDREIFDVGSAREHPDEQKADEREANNELLDYMSQSEGWDGQPLSDEEQFAQLSGSDSDLLVDRPLQHAHELELAERDQQWQGLLQREQAAHQATRNQFAPEIEQQRDAARTNYWDSIGAVPIENEKADAFIGSVEQLKQQRAQMAHALAENKMEMARQKYGDSFSDAYDTLRAMPNNHPTKQRIVQDLFGAVQTGADPGETLMNYAPMLSQSRREPPFARTRDQQFAPRQADYDRANQATYDDLLQAADSQGYGSEADIFNDVFRRR